MLNYRFRSTVSMWWSVKRFVKLAWEVTVCFCDISFTSFITFFLHNFSIINFDGPIHLHYIYGDLESSVSCNWKKTSSKLRKQCALWVFAPRFCICLHCEYLQHGSVFVCTVSICSMVLYLFALWVFAAWFCICLHCEYLQHGSVFAACF